MLALEVVCKVVHETVDEVLAPQVRVARRGLHLENSVVDAEQRHVERAPEVEYQDVLLAVRGFAVEAVRERGCRWLVDDAEAVQPAMEAASLVACR